MEYPHNAVLLLCSSHDKGCRPYMCGTSYRYSNCLDQFKKAYEGHEKCQVVELACPLCRGQVKGWTVVEPAREYLNAKRRSCMQDECTFHGTYKELRKHMRAAHPCAQPREVDPALEQKWKRLELERERRDVITTIRATTPGAYVMGDYVIEGNGGFDSDDDDDDFEDDEGGFDASGDHNGIGNQNILEVLLLWQAFRSEGNGGGGFNSRLRRLRQRSYEAFEAEGGHPPLMPTSAASASSEEDDLGVAEGRVGAGRAEQRRRRRRRSRQRSVIDFT
ncbi:hypothetical protein QJS10_CPA07g00513 [Acorus calamus]|uniref:Uncharacterized protein n=1 Tax=Acorus calamus TaxID=4465 RepID=A0AAV9EGQ9_ACOCL|nr:hypothetical protein QJS10_CPA07g00513 [Acorus calamus]